MSKLYNLEDVSTVDLKHMRERCPNLDIEAFVNACNKLIKQTKTPELATLETLTIERLNPNKTKVVNINEITKEYNVLASKAKILTTKEMKSLIFHKFYLAGVLDLDDMINVVRKNLITDLMNAYICWREKDYLKVLIHHYQPDNLFVYNLFTRDYDKQNEHSGFQSLFNKDHYRPMLYRDLVRSVLPDYTDYTAETIYNEENNDA